MTFDPLDGRYPAERTRWAVAARRIEARELRRDRLDGDLWEIQVEKL